jgi:hypothetical protein
MADKIKVVIEVDPSVTTTIAPFTPTPLGATLASSPKSEAGIAATKTASGTSTPGDADVDVDVDF